MVGEVVMTLFLEYVIQGMGFSLGVLLVTFLLLASLFVVELLAGRED